MRDGALYAVAPDGTDVHCLARLGRDPNALAWGPRGDRLLVDADLVVTAAGAHPSGFEPGTPGITWSQPRGTALIAPSPDGTQLLHVSSTDPGTVTDVAGLATTWVAAYHPSGVAIVVAGVALDGSEGVFITDNHGQHLKQLARLDDPADRITALAVSGAGNVVSFVHDHRGGTLQPGEPAAHIHELVIPGLTLTDLASLDDVPTHLVASDTSDALAWMIDRSTASSVTSFKYRDDVHLVEASAEPLGMLADGSTLVMERPVPTRTGAGNLWLVPATGDPVLVVSGVAAAATRTVHGPWIDLPADIEAQAPG